MCIIDVLFKSVFCKYINFKNFRRQRAIGFHEFRELVEFPRQSQCDRVFARAYCIIYLMIAVVLMIP